MGHSTKNTQGGDLQMTANVAILNLTERKNHCMWKNKNEMGNWLHDSKDAQYACTKLLVWAAFSISYFCCFFLLSIVRLAILSQYNMITHTQSIPCSSCSLSCQNRLLYLFHYAKKKITWVTAVGRTKQMCIQHQMVSTLHIQRKHSSFIEMFIGGIQLMSSWLLKHSDAYWCYKFLTSKNYCSIPSPPASRIQRQSLPKRLAHTRTRSSLACGMQ